VLTPLRGNAVPTRIAGCGHVGVRGRSHPYPCGVPLRVVIAEDDYLVREGIARLLEEEPDVEVVAAYPDGAAVLANVAGDVPDLVITDIRMPPAWQTEGLSLARELHASNPAAGVIVLSQVASAEHAAEIFAHGTDRRAYVLKERITDRSSLMRVIRAVSAGGSYVDPDVVASLVSARKATPSPLDELTSREREVLALVAEGLNNGAIAKRLYLTKRSVERHINAIFLKLSLPDEVQVSRRVAAALLFLGATSN
jgi:DNA-binding NarL/FixJ family response regulator